MARKISSVGVILLSTYSMISRNPLNQELGAFRWSYCTCWFRSRFCPFVVLVLVCVIYFKKNFYSFPECVQF